MRANEFIQQLKWLRRDRNEQDEIEYSEQPSEQNYEIMIPPLQQELEMKKASNGKQSDVISQLLEPDEDYDNCDSDEYDVESPVEKIVIIRAR